MTVEIIIGDALTELRKLPADSVDCCVTSPPYWGLRDYGTAEWEGGEEGCDHKQATARKDGGRANVNGFNGSTAADSDKGALNYRDVCGKCGARRIDRQLGLEPTPDEYIAGMVEVFREVRRVLRDDGTLWLNIGDSYATGASGFGASGGSYESERKQWTESPARERRKIPSGIKPKDLIGIPWLLAFALRADGWWLRQDIIWSKPNPMPESVTDRCTKAHEYLFLLAKSQRYYFDAEAIAEPSVYPGDERHLRTDNTIEFARPDGGSRARPANPTGETRNKRSVWTVATQPFSEAHFATFPPDLIEPCIKAGCPVGGTVLDPFFGAGTTGLVADRLQRNCIGIELNPDYAAMARRRIDTDRGSLLDAMEAA